jgi:radical SAM protein (TIGR01212 family)
MRWLDKPYHSLDYELKNIFGEKIYKIALNAGMTCPNRDGTCGTRGCIFCSEGGSGDFAATGSSIAKQLEDGKKLFNNKRIGSKFIAYFQAYTNTYAPIEVLEQLFSEALSEPYVVGISIATRPDCLDNDVILLLESLKLKYHTKFIWVELGLQTIHEKTAEYIRRGYSLDVYDEAVMKLKSVGISVITHVILGLPGENKEMMLETCRYVGNIMADSGIKLQLLHVLKNTDLAIDYANKTFEVLDFMEYIDIVISCLEILPPEMVIHRVTGDGPKDLLIAPTWSLDKRRVLNTLHKEMKSRNTYQSKLFDGKYNTKG